MIDQSTAYKVHKRLLANQHPAPRSTWTYTNVYKAQRSVLRILGFTALLLFVILALLPVLPLLVAYFGRP